MFTGARLATLLSLAGFLEVASGQVLYVPNPPDFNLSAYVIDADSGNLTELLPRTSVPGRPQAVGLDPQGRFLYVVNFNDPRVPNSAPTVAGYAINASTGGLTAVPGSPPSVSNGPSGVTVDPSGTFVYVTNQGANSIGGFRIDAATGSLTRLSGFPMTAGAGPSALVFDPAGKFAYVSHRGSNNILAYSLNSSSGALTAVPGSPFAAGGGVSAVAVHPGGKFVYASNRGTNNVSAYSVNATSGALTPVAGSPFTTGAPGPEGVAIDPSGKFLYVPNSLAGSVAAFRIDANTGLLTRPPNSQYGVGGQPSAVVVDPLGKYLYVMVQGNNQIASFSIAPDTGALTPVPGPATATGTSPARSAAIQFSPPILPPMIARAAVNAASLALPGLPNAGLAPGSIFSVRGQNLGPAVRRASSVPLSTSLEGASVQVALGDVTIDALVLQASSQEVLALLPSSAPLGDGAVVVTYRGRASNAVPIRVVPTAFGIRTRNDAGSGPALVQTLIPDAAPVPNTLLAAAQPGQTLALAGTGLGAVSYDETVPGQEGDLPVDVAVLVGNKSAAVIYHGRSTALPGLDEIRFQLPTDVQTGCYVPLAVVAGGVVSNFTSISIAQDGKTCSDPYGVAAADLDLAQSAGRLRTGNIVLTRLKVLGLGVMDSADWAFNRYDLPLILKSNGIDMHASQNSGGLPPVGTCMVAAGRSMPDGAFDTPPDPSQPIGIDAGASLNLVGPS
ncbi:MAG: beta-propeller fold lactonase family protein, partial [Acidobacteria bacterium]|nr:beta-propeller fold lactonase family protein [Acidobacteriota bacterium]